MILVYQFVYRLSNMNVTLLLSFSMTLVNEVSINKFSAKKIVFTTNYFNDMVIDVIEQIHFNFAVKIKMNNFIFLSIYKYNC